MSESTQRIALAFNPDTPWLREVFPGILQGAEERGWVLEFVQNNWELPFQYLPNGVIYAAPEPPPFLKGVPGVSLIPCKAPHVITDNRQAGAMACEHLLERGYRQLLFFQTGDVRDPVPFLREQGFRQAAREAGVEINTFTIGPRTRKRKKWILEEQVLDLADFLQVISGPIGACACNPEHVQRLHYTCRQAELRIPEEVGIISPTESAVILPFLQPGISSVHHDRHRIGYEAVCLLHERLRGNPVPNETRIPPKEIIIRGSTDHRIVDDPLCGEIVNHIWDHLEHAPSTEELAQRFHLSERTLYRRFHVHVGRTPSEEYRHARVETAKRLLVTTRNPLVDIALSCGYSSQCAFNRHFKRETDTSPGVWREMHGIS